MRWADGRGYVAPTQGNRNRQVQKNLEEIDRRMNRERKPKKATPGGIVGVAEVLSQAGTVSVNIGGLNADSVRYTAPSDPFGSGADISWVGFDSANPSRMTLEVGGWYSAQLGITLEWTTATDAPATCNPIIYFGGAGYDWDNLWVPATKTGEAQGGFTGLHQFLDIGPFYAQDAFTVLQAQCRLGNATGTALSNAVIAWKITRWS